MSLASRGPERRTCSKNERYFEKERWGGNSLAPDKSGENESGVKPGVARTLFPDKSGNSEGIQQEAKQVRARGRTVVRWHQINPAKTRVRER